MEKKFGHLPIYYISSKESVPFWSSSFPASTFHYVPFLKSESIPYQHSYLSEMTIRRIYTHFNAILSAYESNCKHCLILEDSIDIESATSTWRMPLTLLLYRCLLKNKGDIVQLYTDNLSRISLLLTEMENRQSICSELRTKKDTGGYKCYYLTRNAISRIVSAYQSFDGTWNIDKHHKTEFDMSDMIHMIEIKGIAMNVIKKKQISQDHVSIEEILFFTHSNQHTPVNQCNILCIPLMWEIETQKEIHSIQERIPLFINLSELTYFRIFMNGYSANFFTGEDGFNIHYIHQFLQNTFLSPYRLVEHPEEANVLIESPNAIEMLVHKKKWSYTIQVTFELYYNPPELYDFNIGDIILRESKGGESETIITTNILRIPTAIQFAQVMNVFSFFTENRFITRTTLPTYFCYSNISSKKHMTACRFVEQLNKASFLKEAIHQYGSYQNNTGGYDKYFSHWTSDYTRMLSQYRFVFCFEEDYSAKTISDIMINAFVAKTIPIYWGENIQFVTSYFNPESFLYLEENTIQAMHRLIKKIELIEQNPDLYLQIVNSPIILSDSMFHSCSFSNIQTLINKIEKK